MQRPDRGGLDGLLKVVGGVIAQEQGELFWGLLSH